MNPIGFVKEHPYMVAGGVFVVGVVLVMALSGGGSSEVVYAAPDNSAAVESNNMLAQYQIQAQVASKGLELETAQNASDNDTAYKIAAATFDFQNKNAVLSADVAKATLNAQVSMSDNAYKLGVYNTEAQRDLALAQNDTSRIVGLSTIDANKSIALAEIGGTTFMHQMDASVALQTMNAENDRLLRLAQMGYASKQQSENAGIFSQQLDNAFRLSMAQLAPTTAIPAGSSAGGQIAQTGNFSEAAPRFSASQITKVSQPSMFNLKGYAGTSNAVAKTSTVRGLIDNLTGRQYDFNSFSQIASGGGGGIGYFGDAAPFTEFAKTSAYKQLAANA